MDGLEVLVIVSHSLLSSIMNNKAYDQSHMYTKSNVE